MALMGLSVNHCHSDYNFFYEIMMMRKLMQKVVLVQFL